MSDYRDQPDRRDLSRYDYDERPRVNYDSHYDEGEDQVLFVNVIDLDIPFFQLVWFVFKILLAIIVAGGFLYLLGMLLYWVMALPAVQNLLPDGSAWFQGILNR